MNNPKNHPLPSWELPIYDEDEECLMSSHDGTQIAYHFPNHCEIEFLEPQSRTPQWAAEVSEILRQFAPDVKLVKWGKCRWMLDYTDAGYILPFEDCIAVIY